MMKCYKVVVTPIADRDLGEIFEYIAQMLHAPSAADQLVERIYAALQSLAHMPYRHPLSRDSFLARQGMRVFAVKKYLIFYAIDEEKQGVVIHRIHYGKRNHAAIFLGEDNND